MSLCSGTRAGSRRPRSACFRRARRPVLRRDERAQRHRRSVLPPALAAVAALAVSAACAGADLPAAGGALDLEEAVLNVSGLPAPGNDHRSAAVLAVDNSTGEIVGRAVVGEASAAPLGGGSRPAASLAKVVVLAAVLESGVAPGQVLAVPRCIALSGRWACARSSARTSVAEALAHSNNPAFVLLTDSVGPSTVVEYGSRVGMDLNPSPALPLGIDPVPMESVAALFVALANDGATLDITDSDGSALADAAGRLVSADTARTMRSLLRLAVTEGTGSAADGPDEPYGKTGTAEGHTDAWFAGSTDALTIVVWVGSSDEASEAGSGWSESADLSGGGLPARIFRAVADMLGARFGTT